jgi:hypothetical protein
MVLVPLATLLHPRFNLRVDQVGEITLEKIWVEG